MSSSSDFLSSEKIQSSSSTSEYSPESIDYGTVSISSMSLFIDYYKKIEPTFSNPSAAEELSYDVQDETIAYEENGKIYAIGTGSTSVTAYSEHFSTTFRVSVQDDTQFGSKVSLRERSYKNAGMPEEGRTLFMGDSFFDTSEFWTDFYAKYYGDYNCYSMGISATTASDWFYYVQRLIIPFAPENVVIHIGTNDINDDGNTGETAFIILKALLEELHEELPSTKIFIFSIEPSICFKGNFSKANTANGYLASYAESNQDWLTYLDSWTPFLDDTGMAADASLLRADGLHPLLSTYEIYDNLLKEVLELTPLE